MATTETSIHIDRPVDDVFGYATNVDTMPQWLSTVAEVEQLTDGPVGEGTRIRAVGKMVGRRSSMVVEVTEIEPGTRFGYRGEMGPFKSLNSYLFESVAGGTTVTHTNEFELSGFLGWAEPLVSRMLHRQFKANLAALKDRLEAQAANDG